MVLVSGEDRGERGQVLEMMTARDEAVGYRRLEEREGERETKLCICPLCRVFIRGFRYHCNRCPIRSHP